MAIDFLGTDEYINCSSPATIDNLIRGSMSVAWWAYQDDVAADDRFFDKRAASSGWFVGRGNPANTSLRFFVDFSSTSPYWESSAGTLSSGTWDHFAITWVGNSTANDPIFYKNGIAITTTEARAGGGGICDDSALALMVGSNNGAASFFDGRMEDIRLFNRILSAAEVATLAAGYRGPLGGEALWLPMDDFSEPFYSSGALSSVAGAAKSRIYDRSGNGNHGTPHNGLAIQPVTAAPWTNPNGSTTTDYAFDFDGSDDVINCGSSAGLDQLTTWSVTLWANLDNMGEGNNGRFVGKEQWGLDMRGTSASPRVGFYRQHQGGAGSWQTNSSVTMPGAWHHLAVTYDRSSTANDPLFYVDGSTMASTETSAPAGAVLDDSASNIYIGTDGSGVVTVDGRMEDVRVFNRILSAAEVATLAAGSRAKLGGEVLWLSASHRQGVGQFDAIPLNADNVVPDLSGNGNHGTPSGRPTGAASIAPRMSGWIPQ